MYTERSIVTCLIFVEFTCDKIRRAADKVRCVIGEQMYKLSRDELKETFGANNGIRLFSQLQKDKERVYHIIIIS